MRRMILCLVLLFTVTLALWGCKSPEKTETPAETKSTETKSTETKSTEAEILDMAGDFEGAEESQEEVETTQPSGTSATEPSLAPPSQGGIELPMIPG